ncbi:MAG: carbohydrate ABC transporter substrate-binding protein [Thermotogaceae bacterium]|nr:carbohydrate ABC transporter substrate-binding protein [Thermotogaceae bacterium]
MRKFIIISLLILSVLLISKTLTVIGPWAGAEEEKFLPVLKAFEEKTGIKVEYRIYRAEDLANLLPAQFNAGKTPGDVIFMWGWFILDQAKKGHVMEVSDIISEKDYLPGVLNAVKLNGKLYGAAYTGKVKPGFWYRKSFFKKYNLRVPSTWDEFVDLLEKIKKIPGIKAPIASGDGVGWPLSDVTEHFIITFAGPNVHKDLIEGNIKWESHTVRYAFEKLVSLLKKGYFGEPTEWTMVLKQWWNGDYGLYFMGSWITGMVDDPDDLGIFALPGAKGVVFGADYAFVPKYTKYPEEAKKLLAFLCGAEGQKHQVQQGGHIATNKLVPLDAYPPVDREVAKIIVKMEALTDLDDSVGGAFQTAFWDQLKLLWVKPDRLDDVLRVLDEKMK